jgi:hypothetical protein
MGIDKSFKILEVFKTSLISEILETLEALKMLKTLETAEVSKILKEIRSDTLVIFLSNFFTTISYSKFTFHTQVLFVVNEIFMIRKPFDSQSCILSILIKIKTSFDRTSPILWVSFVPSWFRLI